MAAGEEVPIGKTFLRTSRRFTLLAGGAAGNLTLTGITDDDFLESVQSFTFTLTEGTPNTINAIAVADLTAEFSITAANTINNTGGTNTTGRLLLVVWQENVDSRLYDEVELESG